MDPEFLDWISETRIARFALILIDLDDMSAIRDALDTQEAALLMRHLEQRIRRRLRGGHLMRLPRAGCFAAVVRDPKGAEDLARIGANCSKICAGRTRSWGRRCRPRRASASACFPTTARAC